MGIVGLVVFWVAVPIALVVYVVRALRRTRHIDGADRAAHWYLWPFSSSADGVGQLLLVLGIALAGIAVELTLRHFGVGSRPSYVLLATTLVAVALGWWQRAPLLVMSSVLAGFSWWGFSAARWAEATSSPRLVPVGVGVIAIALIAIAVARILERRSENRRLGFFAWLPGAFTLFGVLFALSSQDGISALGSKAATSPFTHSWKLAAGLGILLIVTALLLALAARLKATSLAETSALSVVFAVALTVAAWPPHRTVRSSGEYDLFGTASSAQLSAAGMLWATVFNVLLLLLLLGLVFLGYQRREDWLVTFGALLLFVFVLFKYFDWLFSLLDRSVAFIGAGLLFLGVGWLMERGRRSVLAAMEAGNELA